MVTNELLRERYRHWKDYAEELDTLDNDLKLIREGYKIYYAVDFSEIYRYAHPIEDESSFPIAEDSESMFARERMTLSFLFQQYGSLLVPDPYLLELDDHLRFFVGLSAYYNLMKYTANLTPIPKTQNPFLSQTPRPIIDSINQCVRDGKWSPKCRREVVDFISKRYNLLWLIHRSRSADRGLKRIRARFNDNTLLRLTDNLPDRIPGKIDICSKKLMESAKKNFHEIFTHKREDRPTANLMDEIAAETIKELNEILIPCKGFIILISNDRLMLSLGSGKELTFSVPEVTDKCHSIRGLRYIRAQIYAANPSTVTLNHNKLTVDESRLKHHKNLQGQLLQVLGEMGITNYTDWTDKTVINKNLAKILDDIWHEIGRYQNVRSFMASNKRLIANYEEDLAELHQIPENELKILSFLKQDPDFEAGIQSTANRIFTEAQKTIEQINLYTKKARDWMSVLSHQISLGHGLYRGRQESHEYIPIACSLLAPYQARFVKRVFYRQPLDLKTDRVIINRLQKRLKNPKAIATQNFLLVLFNNLSHAFESNLIALEASEGKKQLRTALLVVRSSLHRITDMPEFEDWLVDELTTIKPTQENSDFYPLVLRERALIRWIRIYLLNRKKPIPAKILSKCIAELNSAMAGLKTIHRRIRRLIAGDLILLYCWRNHDGDLDSAFGFLNKLRIPMNLDSAIKLPPLVLLAQATFHRRQLENVDDPDEKLTEEQNAETCLKWAKDNLWLREWHRGLIENEEVALSYASADDRG